jgi:integrase
MATIGRDPNGTRRILFVASDGTRKTVRLGKVPMKVANEVKARVEGLNAAKAAGVALDADTAAWVARIGDDLAAKLAAVDLIPEREPAEAVTLGGFVRRLIDQRADAKPRTRANLEQAAAKLLAHFGAETLIDRITSGGADDWVAALRREYAPAYVSRLVKYGKQFFHAARRAGLVKVSPFDDVKAGTMANPGRLFFVTHEDAEKVIAACPDGEWRLIVALARYGGLRCPSELVALTWADVDWERGRFLVKAPKTAHHEDGGCRWVPLFPELLPHLEAAFDAAEPGAVYVVARRRCHDTNLRTGLERIIYRAGLLPWPKLFQNMRASRETELTRDHALHVVTAWIGNSARVASKHYLQVTDADFDRAAGRTPPTVPRVCRAAHKTAQSGADVGSLEGTAFPAGNKKGLEIQPCHPESLADADEKYARQESNL